jgi:hypothetical protein
MEKTYVIKWKRKLGAICHQSKKLFSREEAEQLAEELNQDHPEFIHEPHMLSSEGHAAGKSSAEPAEPTIVKNIDFTAANQFDLPIREAALAH